MAIIKDFLNRFKSTETIKKELDTLVTKSITGRSLQWLIDNRGSSNDSNLIYPAKNSHLIFSCIQIIGDNVPDAPLKLLDVTSNNELPYNNDVVELFNLPDEDTTWFDFISRSAVYYALYGECFWVMIPSDGMMNPDINYSLPARLVVVDPKTLTHILDHEYNLTGWLYAPTDRDNTLKQHSVILPAELVIQTKNVNPYNNWRGLSVLDSLRNIMDVDYKAVKYQSRFFDNGAIPGAVITMDKAAKSLSKKDMIKIVKEFDQTHKGVNNAGKTGALGPGMDIKTLGQNNREMRYVDVLNYTRDHILAAMRVHKTVLGFTEGINRATIKEQKEMLWSYTLKPITQRIQHTINYKFLAKFYPTAKCKFDYSRLIESQKISITDISILQNLGYTRNEINTRMELGFDEDPEGDIRRYPMNLMETDIDSKPENKVESKKKTLLIEGVPTNNEDANDTNNVVTKAIKKSNSFHNIYVKTQAMLETGFRGRLKKFGIKQRTKVIKSIYNDIKAMEINKDSLMGRIDDIFDGTEDEVLEKALRPIYVNIMEKSGEMAYDFMGMTNTYMLDHDLLVDKINKIKGINQTTYNQIKMVISDGIESGDTLDQIAKSIKDVYKDLNGYRSLRIARTETGSLMSETSQKEYIMNGVQYKSWVTAGSGVRPEHVSNAAQGKIPITDAFSNGERFPGDNSVNCRCSILPNMSN